MKIFNDQTCFCIIFVPRCLIIISYCIKIVLSAQDFQLDSADLGHKPQKWLFFQKMRPPYRIIVLTQSLGQKNQNSINIEGAQLI